MPESSTAAAANEASLPDADRPWADRVALVLGVASAAWTLVAWMPPAIPAWPGASLGVLALAFAWPRGRPLPRATGAFLGALGLLGASAQIAALWGIAAALAR